MMDDLTTITYNKKISTGVELRYDAAPDLSPVVSSEDGFASLISQYYKFFREALVVDVAFLRGIEQHPAIVEFDAAVYQLRTAQQHDDNDEATAFYRSWVAENVTWQSAADALSQSLQRALGQLSRISSRVRRDERLARAWRDRASVEPASVFASVCLDLATQFDGRRNAILIRNIERRMRSLHAKADVRGAVEAFCVEEIINQSKRLPVPYHEVLDRLNLLGRPMARAAILLAYSISASTTLRGEDFMVRVEEAWKVSAG
jgi:hypothetical protein